MKTSAFTRRNSIKAFSLLLMLFLYRPLSAQVNEDYFKVTNTYYESSSGGAYGSGSSEYYVFTLKFKKDAKIYFDTIWFNNDPKPVYFYNTGGVIPQNFHKGDSIMITVNSYYPGERDLFYNADLLLKEKLKENEKIYKNPQPQISCIALFQFYVNNVKYYYAVKKIDHMKYNALP
jgi:hypothetical protein